MLISNSVSLTDVSSVGEARRVGLRLGATLGFSEVKNGELGIIITEAARNTLVHGRGGEMVLSAAQAGGVSWVDVLALDKGPGISNLARAFEDGFSTGGTPGTGLGAIRRLASQLDLFSSNGTALWARVIDAPPGAASKTNADIAALSVPYPGERVCGDGVAWEQRSDRILMLMADGLGHGPDANDAAEEAQRVFYRHSASEPGEILSRMHDALKKTRGAAAAVVEIRPAAGTVTYAGVGNISAVVSSKAGDRNMVSHNGTLGHTMSRVQEFKVEWPKGAMLIMHSDGLQSRWDLSKYPGLIARSPALIAGLLYRDYRRLRDDCSIAVIKAK